jgi:hypothetical protein
MGLSSALPPLFSAPASAEPITQAERDRAVHYLRDTLKKYLESTTGLSDPQWRFKPSPEKWSVAECAEHIAITEDALYRMVIRIMKEPPEPEKKAEVKGKEEMILNALPDRSRKATAPELVRPTNRWPAPEALIAHFKQMRARTLAYAETTQDDLRSHFYPHFALGQFDAYQWLLFIAGHCDRHAQQLNEVKADPNFPKQ